MIPGFEFMNSTNLIWKTVFLIRGCKSTDTEGPLCALFYTILHKGLQHPRIWCIYRIWEPIPLRY